MGKKKKKRKKGCNGSSWINGSSPGQKYKRGGTQLHTEKCIAENQLKF